MRIVAATSRPFPVSASHYENFPVASFLLPRAERTAVLAIYRFARAADDVADEGNATPAMIVVYAATGGVDFVIEALLLVRRRRLAAAAKAR